MKDGITAKPSAELISAAKVRTAVHGIHCHIGLRDGTTWELMCPSSPHPGHHYTRIYDPVRRSMREYAPLSAQSVHDLLRVARMHFPARQLHPLPDRLLITNNMRAAVIRKHGKYWEAIYGDQMMIARDPMDAMSRVARYMKEIAFQGDTWIETDDSAGTTIQLP